MRIKYSKIIPFKGFMAMNLYGTLFIRKEFKERWESRYTKKTRDRILNHESIHSAQAHDFCKINWIGYTIFYIVYRLLWIVEIIRPPYNKAYKDVCFEKEAYINEDDLNYLKTRKKWSWMRKMYWRNYITKKKK